jgi:hypothetical protein
MLSSLGGRGWRKPCVFMASRSLPTTSTTSAASQQVAALLDVRRSGTRHG